MINKQPKKTTTRAKKEYVVAKLSEKLGKATALVFTNYQGLTHKQLESLKKNLKPVDAELVVAKNSLLALALGKVDFTSSTSSTFGLSGPTATLIAYSDVTAPLKALAKIIKELKLPEIKFGIFENKIMSAEQVNTLSTLPSREVLITQVVGGLKSPLFGLHRALNWNIQRLVLTLNAIQSKKR